MVSPTCLYLSILFLPLKIHFKRGRSDGCQSFVGKTSLGRGSCILPGFARMFRSKPPWYDIRIKSTRGGPVLCGGRPSLVRLCGRAVTLIFTLKRSVLDGKRQYHPGLPKSAALGRGGGKSSSGSCQRPCGGRRCSQRPGSPHGIPGGAYQLVPPRFSQEAKPLSARRER